MDEGGGIVLKRKKVINILVFLLLTLISVITLFPIIWTAITSLKTDVQMFAIPPDLLPNPATLSHYKEVITGNFQLISEIVFWLHFLAVQYRWFSVYLQPMDLQNMEQRRPIQSLRLLLPSEWFRRLQW